MKPSEIRENVTYANEDESEVYRANFVEELEVLYQVLKPYLVAENYPFQRWGKAKFAAWAHHVKED